MAKDRGKLDLRWWAIGLAIGTALAVVTSNWALFVVGIAIGIAMGAWRPGTGGGESAAMHPADPADASGTDASGGGADGGGGGD